MIISKSHTANAKDFLNLVSKADIFLRKRVHKGRSRFIGMSPTEFEKELFECFEAVSSGSVFENTIELVSGKKFPDMVIDGKFGVEVKTTTSNKWKTQGNSILESSRAKGVDVIYIYFAKLSIENIDFKYRLYQECLYDISVTHYPRYRVDMDTPIGHSIFDKMSVSYDEFRSFETIETFKKYIRSTNPDGELWWLDDSDERPNSPVVRLFTNLCKEEKHSILIESMVLFPAIFGKGNSRFARVAAWLAAKHGVTNHSLRDIYTAGGRKDIVLNGVTYENMPKIIFLLNTEITNILSSIPRQLPSELMHYWNLPTIDNPALEWRSLVLNYFKESTSKNNELKAVEIILFDN